MTFAKYPPENISEAITVFKQDVELTHGIVHGDENTEVLTENGLVPSFAKTTKRLVDEVAAATGVDISLREDLEEGTPVIGGVTASHLVSKTDYLTPDLFDTLQDAANAASAQKKKLMILSDVFVSSPLVLIQPIEIEICGGAAIKTSDTFSGGSVVQLGDTMQLSELIKIHGAGDIDARYKCDITIDARFCRFSEIGVKRVLGGNKRGMRIGHPDALAASYEVNISDNTTFWLGDVANSVDSIGIYYEKATDCYASKTFVRGYRCHFKTSSTAASIEYQMCHGWNRPVNGPLEVCFDDEGSQTTFVQCYADTPTNYGDNSITEVYGWRLNGFSPQLLACRIFINQALTPNIAVTNLVKAVHFERELYANIFGFKAAGGSPSMKYASLVSGPRETSTVIGLIDDGPSSITDADSRKENYTDQKIFEYINGLKVNKFVNLTAPAGVALPLSMQRDGLDRFQVRLNGNAETGLNAGSDWQLNAHADDGSYLATMLQVNRRFKKLQAIEGLQVSKQLEFSNYTVATLPTGEPRGLIYVADGNAGQPCLAVFFDGTWKRIPLGATVSTT